MQATCLQKFEGKGCLKMVALFVPVLVSADTQSGQINRIDINKIDQSWNYMTSLHLTPGGVIFS